MKHWLKHLVESHFPSLAAWARTRRHRAQLARVKPYSLPNGLVIHGDTSMIYSGGQSPELRLRTGEMEVFERWLAQCGAFVDIGANFGIYSLLAAKAGKPVVAFEPLRENYESLLGNIQRNRLEGIEAHALALSDKPGVLAMAGFGEMASLTPGWANIHATQTQWVAANRLDHLLAGRFAGQRLFIKLDVEGHEAAVLEGAAETLARNPAPVWLVENGAFEHFSDGVNPGYVRVFDFFWSRGCDVRDLSGRSIQRADALRWASGDRAGYPGINYLCVPPSGWPG